ncbi:MAG: imidazole glycerol phosphate synthase subunit HisH [Firmicutes bacterium]|nr:imidazole glycerol phosphate synthase subunit HisH [Bacillota bacterium]
MIAIIDYGVGNLFSLRSSLAAIGVEAEVTGDVGRIRAAEKLILPGVGAFGDAAKKLRDCGLADVICAEAAAGKPLLGICLGMQLLFEKSYEYGEHEGLGLIPGSVQPLLGAIDPQLKVPQMGWNALDFCQPDSPLFRHIKSGDCVYFVHSYHAVCPQQYLLATAEYDINVTAAVAHGNVYGCQFHPEKSGSVGLAILRAFAELEVAKC